MILASDYKSFTLFVNPKREYFFIGVKMGNPIFSPGYRSLASLTNSEGEYSFISVKMGNLPYANLKRAHPPITPRVCAASSAATPAELEARALSSRSKFQSLRCLRCVKYVTGPPQTNRRRGVAGTAPNPNRLYFACPTCQAAPKTPQDAFLATLGDAARWGGIVGTLWTPRCNVGRFWRPDGRFSRVFSRCKRCAS